jgi:predicted RNA-binding Zn-ribbon protein involved in translation (DUF1610 family)
MNPRQMLSRPHVCPECGYRTDEFVPLYWGGRQWTAIAPFICRRCGDASIMNLRTMRVEATAPGTWAFIAMTNPRLWRQIRWAQRQTRQCRRVGGAA